MILADENLNARFIDDLRAAGYEVLSVYEQFRGISDPSVVSLAMQEVVKRSNEPLGESLIGELITNLKAKYQKRIDSRVSTTISFAVRNTKPNMSS